jgi:hypothetical protein
LISLSRSHCLSRNVLFGLSPNALCRINLRLISDDLNPRINPKIQVKRFLSKLKVVLTQSKKFVVNKPLEARSALNLYECAVSSNKLCIEAFINNAD